MGGNPGRCLLATAPARRACRVLLLYAPTPEARWLVDGPGIRACLPYVRPTATHAQAWICPKARGLMALKTSAVRCARGIEPWQGGELRTSGRFQHAVAFVRQLQSARCDREAPIWTRCAQTLAHRAIPRGQTEHGKLEETRSTCKRTLAAWSTTVILDDSYHMVTLDQQRHIVAERSVDFSRAASAAAAKERRNKARRHERRQGRLILWRRRLCRGVGT